MLLRAAANAAALAFLTWSTPAMPAAGGEGGAGSPKGTWFAMPDAWTINCQKYYVHWLIFPLWEPAMMRVSVWKDSSAVRTLHVPHNNHGLRVWEATPFDPTPDAVPIAPEGPNKLHMQRAYLLTPHAVLHARAAPIPHLRSYLPDTRRWWPQYTCYPPGSSACG